MTITQLEYVLAVEKFKHFGKAARACSITQPTLSMQLQKLEDELGIVIFDRSKNPILHTEAGNKIIEQAKITVREFKKIYSLIHDMKAEVSGDFNLGVIPTLAPYLIPLFAKIFSDNYPKVNLQIEEFKTEDIIYLLKEDKIDAGLMATPLTGEDLIERTLFYEPFLIYASKAHPLLEKEKIKESDLKRDDIWLLNEGHCFRQQILNFCHLSKATANKNRPNGNLKFESGHIDTLLNMLKANNGFTFIPKLAYNQLSQSEKNLTREFQNPQPTREISLVHNRIFLKEKIIDSLEKTIIECIPLELLSLKKSRIEVINF